MATRIPPTYADVKYDVKYGPYDRNRFDIWLATSDNPTPLVIFYHGGGFVGGDKSKYDPDHWKAFLQAGVSFAAVDYRYRTDPENDQGILGSLNDCRRALQVIRNKAPDLNIDKGRVGAYGKSAGAGTSLWIAFKDDMADPTSDVPYLQESTRLKVVGALATQASYDLMQWPEILQIPYLTRRVRRKFLDFAVECYALNSVSELFEAKGRRIRSDLDFLAQMSSDDPPMYVRNGTPDCFSNMNCILHHPLHAKALKMQADMTGIQDYCVDAPAVGLQPDCGGLVEFFLHYL